MFVGPRVVIGAFLIALFGVVYTGSNAAAQDAAWRVAISSGEVWISNSQVQKVAVTDQTVVQPGDNIRTGQTGRVLLMRGDEYILVSPNAVIGVPGEKQSGLSTVITQQAGSILLNVEKRNVKHFEVETPYLAAVVKGTRFRVTVAKDNSRVDVLRGQVEVSDFKSGQYALITQGQSATVSADGLGGLSLSGSDDVGPIYQGGVRRSLIIPPLSPGDDIWIPPSAPAASQSHAAASQGTSGPVIASSESDSSGESTEDNSISGVNVSWSRSGEIMSALSIPLSIGGFVALAVSVSRRRRRTKQTPD